MLVTFACEPAAPPLAPNELVADSVYSAIRTDGLFVYYVDDARIQDGVITPGPFQLQLMRVSVTGGSPTVIAKLPPPSDDNYMAEFIIDSTTAYCPIDGQIVAVPLVGGGAPVVLVTEPASVEALTADSTSLYWLEGGALGNNTPWEADVRVMSMPKSGGSPTVLVASSQFLGDSATEIAVAGSTLYWPGSSCSGMGAFACLDNDIISGVPIGGGPASVWISSQAAPGAVATDGTTLYWLNAGSDPSSGAMLGAPITSPATTTTLARSIRSPGVTATDGGYTRTYQVWNIQVASDGTVFWLDAAGSAVYSLQNGTVRTYASGSADQISYFTIDSVNVYWAQNGGIFYTAR